MSSKIIIIVQILFFFILQNLKSQDTLTIKKFDSLIHNYYIKMKLTNELKDSLTICDIIYIIKLENTILKNKFRFRKDQKPYIDFHNYFYIHYAQKAIKSIEGTPTYGSGFYSEKYNVSLGGFISDKRSYYYIKQK